MIDLKRKVARLAAMTQGRHKQFAEELFWRREIENYVKWFRGEWLHESPPPRPDQKVQTVTEELSAILTFFEVRQAEKYLKYLRVPAEVYSGKRVLDVGSGPFPNALCFEGAEVYSLDELIPQYAAAGFPLHCYEQRNRFVAAPAEQMPFPDNFFDAVVSVNAIDHVGDFAQVAREIRRVLRPGGKLRFHVHYHPATLAEPNVLNDELLYKHYGWLDGLTCFHLFYEGKTEHTLWSN